MIVGPDGGVLAEGGRAAAELVIATIDPGEPRFDVAIRHARPWSALAQAGDIYSHRED